MAFKLVGATEAKVGSAILVDGVPCIVRTNDISKTGKHGHAKCKIEAIGILDDKKRVFIKGGHDRLDVPLINKKKAQVLSVMEDKASIMDLESYETIEVPIMNELKGQINAEDQVEYWDIEGTKIIKRKM